MDSTLHPSNIKALTAVEWLKVRRKKTSKSTFQLIGENLFQGSEMGCNVQAKLLKVLCKLKVLGSPSQQIS